MGFDERMRFLAREEIQRDLKPGELTEGVGWSDRLDDLHRELHALATKVAALEERIASSHPSRLNPGAVPAASRPRSGKSTDEQKGSA